MTEKKHKTTNSTDSLENLLHTPGPRIEPGIWLQGKYHIEKKLGAGGMGSVYQATDAENRRVVAIKQILLAQGMEESDSSKRLQREYRFLQAVSHPNLVKTYDLFVTQGQFFLVLEFVPGVSLRDLLQQGNEPWSLAKRVMIANQLCRAVEALNTAGILHRDIKPANIMINTQLGKTTLLDLGLGKNLTQDTKQLTQTGSAVGTPEYMSPEQVLGKISDRSDVFSLGVTLYQLFLWQKTSPFKGESILNSMVQITSLELPRLVSQIHDRLADDERLVYEKLSDVLEKSLAKEPENRLISAGFLADRLAEIYSLLTSNTRALASSVLSANETMGVGWKITVSLSPEQLYDLEQIKKAYNTEDPVKVCPQQSHGTQGRYQKNDRHLNRMLGISIVLWRSLSVALAALMLLVIAGLLLGRNVPISRSQEPATHSMEENVLAVEPTLRDACWNGHYFDFTQDVWVNLAVEKQIQYARVYQEYYAKKIGKNAEETFSIGGTNFVMCLIPPGKFWMGSKDDDTIAEIKECWKINNRGQYDESRHCVLLTGLFGATEKKTTFSAIG